MADSIALQTYPTNPETQELMQGLSAPGDTVESVFDHGPQEKGKPSPIKTYCEAALREYGDQRHLWICIRRGKQTIAHDVAFPNDKTLGILELRKYYGWFKRYFSLYSVTAMQEVKLRFLGVDKAGGIEVVVKPFDYENMKAKYARRLEEILEHEADPFVCGVTIMGARHDAYGLCTSSRSDQYTDETYCLSESCEQQRIEAEELGWLPYMLEFFWQNGIQRKGVEFLAKTHFLYSHSELMYDSWNDARKPYGKSINAFLLVEGWHLKFLLWILFGCLLCSICVVAVITAASHSLDAGMAAGSYTVGFGAAAIAILTFLSAVL